ncbi:MAG TPA: isoprenyl transferase [Azospirillaceae bacterium]|nr:isoprenyl transferase [Azospirillaceae bacterium]
MAGEPSQPPSGTPPAHVAIIMDGNGRWATQRGLPRTAGHKKGVEAVRRALEAAGDLGIRYLTLYSFSSENWNRPQDEVSDLMQLLRFYLRGEIASLHRNGVRLKVIGDRSRLAHDIVQLIRNAEELTGANTGLTLVIALSYGSRAEIVQAARDVALAACDGRLDPEAITERVFAQHLYTRDIPDPDLVIRTSGEKRISNFLLWQLAYAELVFLDTLWPDFTKIDMENAVQEFHRRDRRFGATASSR